MRKRIVRRGVQEVSLTDQRWVEVARLAQVEITSEDATLWFPNNPNQLPG